MATTKYEMVQLFLNQKIGKNVVLRMKSTISVKVCIVLLHLKLILIQLQQVNLTVYRKLTMTSYVT